MTENARREACLRLRALLDKGTPRKVAMLRVRDELRKKKLPCGQTALYVWCKQFGISTK